MSPSYADRSLHTATEELSNLGMVCGINLTDHALPLHLALVEKHNPVGGTADGAVLVSHYAIGSTNLFFPLQLANQILNHCRGNGIETESKTFGLS